MLHVSHDGVLSLETFETVPKLDLCLHRSQMSTPALGKVMYKMCSRRCEQMLQT